MILLNTLSICPLSDKTDPYHTAALKKCDDALGAGEILLIPNDIFVESKAFNQKKGLILYSFMP